MSKAALAVIAVALLMAVGTGKAAQRPRLERDCERQSPRMQSLRSAMDEPSCGGTWLTVRRLGGQIRKLDWECQTSQRLIKREFYFGRGRPELFIETTYMLLDSSGETLRRPRFESRRRYWLHDRSAGRAGVKLRSELRAHGAYLVGYFSAHKADFR